MGLLCCVRDDQFLLHVTGIKNMLLAKIRHSSFFSLLKV